MNEVATYFYGSLGKLLSIVGSLANTVGTINPFRYRRYYYNTETGMNLFAYCVTILLCALWHWAIVSAYLSITTGLPAPSPSDVY
jgi:hypothetical protein